MTRAFVLAPVLLILTYETCNEVSRPLLRTVNTLSFFKKNDCFPDKTSGHCDEWVFAGQNLFLGPTTHLLRPKCCFESHHFRLMNVVHCCLQMRSQKKC